MAKNELKARKYKIYIIVTLRLHLTASRFPESGKNWPLQHKDIVTITAKVWYVSDFNGSDYGTNYFYPPWNEKTPFERAQAVVKNNMNYLNVALGNSMIPIRFQVWGDVQDIKKTDEQISGTTQKVLDA